MSTWTSVRLYETLFSAPPPGFFYTTCSMFFLKAAISVHFWGYLFKRFRLTNRVRAVVGVFNTQWSRLLPQTHWTWNRSDHWRRAGHRFLYETHASVQWGGYWSCAKHSKIFAHDFCEWCYYFTTAVTKVLPSVYPPRVWRCYICRVKFKGILLPDSVENDLHLIKNRGQGG